MNLEKQVAMLSQRIEQLQETIVSQGRLGLSNGRRYIHIKKNAQSLWHYCDDAGTEIRESNLTGYLDHLEIKGDDDQKLHAFVQADYEYVLVSGISTHFSRQLMAAIATMSACQLQRPVVIRPDKGDEAKTKFNPVFCNVIVDGKLIRSSELAKSEPLKLFKMANMALGHQEAMAWGEFRKQTGITSNQLRAIADRLNFPADSTLLSSEQALELQEAALKELAQ